MLILLLLTGLPASAEGVLRIWVSASRDAAALEQASAAFARTEGLTIEVSAMDPVWDRFARAAEDGTAPDILLLPHDRLAALVDAGLIAPLNPPDHWVAGVLPVAMRAVSFDGSVWAYPVGVEGLHLIYNRAIVEHPPASFAEIPAMPLTQGTRRILWDHANPYFTMPLLLGAVDEPFALHDGHLDPATAGTGGPAALAGATLLRQLITDQFLPAEISYETVSTAMNAGRVGMVIDGPWAWQNLRISGIDFGVAPIPAVDGHESRSLLTVHVLAINAASGQRELAARFVETALTADAGLTMWNAGGALGALADLSAATSQTDPHLQALQDITATGIPLPDHHLMQPYWAIMRSALAAISTGGLPPAEALQGAADRMGAPAGMEPAEAAQSG